MIVDDLAYATDVRKARRKTGLKTQEFLTPRDYKDTNIFFKT